MLVNCTTLLIFSLAVSPHLIIKAARQWLHEGTNGSKFERIVFSAKANLSLIEKHMDDYFPLQPFASHDRTESEISESDKAKEGLETETSESDKLQDGTENKVVESDKPQNEKSESDKDMHSNALSALHKRVSTVSIDAIEFEMGDDQTRLEEPIPEDVEPESNTAHATNDINMDTIELELKGVDAEMNNIQSILLEMQQEQQELGNLDEEEEDEDPIGLLRFLGKRSQTKEIVASSSLSAHTSPAHTNLLTAEMQLLSRSLPLLDDEGVSPHFRLNPQREESDV